MMTQAPNLTRPRLMMRTVTTSSSQMSLLRRAEVGSVVPGGLVPDVAKLAVILTVTCVRHFRRTMLLLPDIDGAPLEKLVWKLEKLRIRAGACGSRGSKERYMEMAM